MGLSSAWHRCGADVQEAEVVDRSLASAQHKELDCGLLREDQLMGESQDSLVSFPAHLKVTGKLEPVLCNVHLLSLDV